RRGRTRGGWRSSRSRRRCTRGRRGGAPRPGQRPRSQAHVEVRPALQLVEPLALGLVEDLALEALDHLVAGGLVGGVAGGLALDELDDDQVGVAPGADDADGLGDLAGLEGLYGGVEVGGHGLAAAALDLGRPLGGEDVEVAAAVAG